ncbi:MAG: NAD-dependent epimerase/dehydratase family protein, partial [Acidobacteriaceae bacterium]
MLAFPSAIAERLCASDHHIVVTGAGGWLGMATLEMLDAALGDEMEHRVSAYASRKRTTTLGSGRTITVSPLTDLTLQKPRPTYVFHYAYLGKEKVAELGVDRFLSTNTAINDLVEAYCAKIPRGGMYFASSGAANFAGGSVEDSAREPYGSSKVHDEARYKRLAREDFTVAVCRIFNMAGPFMNKLNEYALGSILV